MIEDEPVTTDDWKRGTRPTYGITYIGPDWIYRDAIADGAEVSFGICRYAPDAGVAFDVTLGTVEHWRRPFLVLTVLRWGIQVGWMIE